MMPDEVPIATLVDGERDASLARDRGLHYGDGVFETLCCVQGRVRFASRHCARLAAGLERLNIRFDAWTDLYREVIALAGSMDRSLIKLIVTRGDAIARGYAPAGRERARRCLLQYAWTDEGAAEAESWVRTQVARLRLGENPALAGLKHLNRLEQVLARAELAAHGAHEALLFSSSGRLVSGTMSNVFLVRDGKLQTPLLDRCGVAGIMRAVVMDAARAAHLPCTEAHLAHDDLAACHEIFLTNARIGIWPVRALDARDVPVGPATRRLQALIAPMLQEARDA